MKGYLIFIQSLQKVKSIDIQFKFDIVDQQQKFDFNSYGCFLTKFCCWVKLLVSA